MRISIMCAGLFVFCFVFPHTRKKITDFYKPEKKEEEKCGHQTQTINAGSNGWARKILLLS